MMVIDCESVGTNVVLQVSGPSWFLKMSEASLFDDFVESSPYRKLGELICPLAFPVLPGKITSHVVFTTGIPSVKTTKNRER